MAHLQNRSRAGRRLSAFAAGAAALACFGVAAPAATAASASPGTGDSGFFTFRPSEGVGGTQINVASGNALIRTRDLVDGPLAYHVVVDRAYNSLSPDTFTILSPRWGFDVGPDTKLTVESNQGVTVRGPSGYRIRFERQTDGTYVAPEGFDGALVKTPSGWTLSRISQNDEFGFDGSGNLTWTKDSSLRDFTVQGTSAAGRTVLSSYGTNSGRRVNLSYNGDSLVRLMDDPASGHHSYRYTAGRLTEYESPTGAKTTYGYDANGFLSEIVEPGGTTIELDVTASGKVHAITTTLPGGVPQTTSFGYTRRTYKTDVTAPDTTRRTYAYDDDWRVTRDYDPDVVPTVTASGELKDLEGGYVGPNRTYPVTVAATQPDGAGLRRLWLTVVPEDELAGQDVPCSTTPFDLVCPQTFDVPLDIDFAPLPEGPATVRGAARDDEQNRGNSTAWEVTVDRSAPIGVAASGELFDAQDGYIDGQGTAALTASAVDPDMTDGTRLSGIARLQLEDVGNGMVATSNVSCTALACPVAASETLNVDTTQLAEGAHQLRIVATDLVGNVTRSDPWTVFVDRTAPNAPGFLDASRDPSDGITDLTWDPTGDPELATGIAGSGVAQYEFRYRDAGGTWTGWATAEADPDFLYEVSGFAEGQSLALEIKVTDAVGNVRNVSEVLTVDPPIATWDNPGRSLPGEAPTGEVAVPLPEEWEDADPEGDFEVDSDNPSVDTGGAGAANLFGGTEPLFRGGTLQPLATTGWDRFLCGAPATGPCGAFDQRAAARYARYYATKRNWEYAYYAKNGNCTNFVSQALHFGNFRFLRTSPGVNDPRGLNRGDGAYFRGHGSWWQHEYRNVLGIRKFRSAHSFSVAPVLKEHLIDRGLGYQINPSVTPLRAGDVIFYRWDGVKIGHANIVVRGGKNVMIAQNSRDEYVSLKAFRDRILANPAYSGGGHPIVVRPQFTRVNLPY